MYRYILLFVFILTLLSCSGVRYPDRMESVFSQAGENISELSKAYEHFYAQEDTLKLDALEFLLSHIQNHSYVQVALFDTTETEIPFHPLDYANLDSVSVAAKRLSDEHGPLRWQAKQRVKDIETITADILIETIEYSFTAWEEKPWAEEIPYEIVRNYIVPYRGSNEPIESWRPYFYEQYKNLENRMEDPTDPIEATRLINEDLKSWFSFDSRFYYHPTDQGLSDMLERKMGRCEDMTNLTMYAMRANAIPVTSDYTPHWADTGNNHAWNALILPEGGAIPFMGCEAHPLEYSLRPVIAKAYRKIFHENPENLAFLLEEDEKAPAWLSGKNYLDVTTDYTPVTDISLALEYELADSVRFAYISVFNAGQWRPIHWGEIENGKVTFDKMGVNILYLPTFYHNEELIPSTDPILVDEHGNWEHIEPAGSQTTLKLISVTRKTIEEATEAKEITFLIPGVEYELFYWQDEWESLGVQTATDEPMIWEDVPAGALYWLIEKDEGREERIFTYEDDKQIWW